MGGTQYILNLVTGRLQRIHGCTTVTRTKGVAESNGSMAVSRTGIYASA